MRTNIILFVVLVFSFNSIFGQTRLERKQLREEKSQKEYVQMKEIVESDSYEFNINRVQPLGGTTINVNDN